MAPRPESDSEGSGPPRRELSLAEAAERSNIPLNQLRRRAATGRLAGARLVRTATGDEWRVPVDALDRLGSATAEAVEEHAPTPTSSQQPRRGSALDRSDDGLARERDELRRERAELERARADLLRLRAELRDAKAASVKESEYQRAGAIELQQLTAQRERLEAERGRLEEERRANEESLRRLRVAAAQRVERHQQLPAEESAARVFLAAEAKELANERRALEDEWARLEAAKDEFAAQRLEAHADSGRERARRAAQK